MISVMLVLFAVLILYIVVSKNLLVEQFESTHIPKQIYCYWHDETLPEFLQFCIDTWKLHNPDYSITLLSKTDAAKMGIMDYKHADTPTRISDFVRLQVLQENGGIWIDISTILNQPLSWVHKSPDCDVVGFYINEMTIDPNYPVIESWFIAAPKGSKFIGLWNREFKRINQFDTIKAYLEEVDALGVQHNIRIPEYLAIHVAAQVTMQLYMPTAKLCLQMAEEGPFKYLVDHAWEIRNASDFFASGEYKSHPMLKLRSKERKHIDHIFPIIKSNY